MNLCITNNLTSYLNSGFSIRFDYEARIGFESFFKGGDECLLSNPGNSGVSNPFNFIDNFHTLYKPVGQFSYMILMYEQNLHRDGIPEQGIPLESTSHWESSCLIDFIGNSGSFYRTVSFDYIHVELNEPTPTPNIPSTDMTNHPFIQSPAFFLTVLLSNDIYIYDIPGCMIILLGNTKTLLITESSCDVASIWEAPYFSGASQAFYDPSTKSSFHGLNKIENKECAK